MLTRQEVRRNMEQDGMYETTQQMYTVMLISIPELKESPEEHLAVAEHVIRQAFDRVGYQLAPCGPLELFSQQLSFTEEDIARATECTKADFKSAHVSYVEIAITATFIWLANAVHEYGDCITEFMYLHYKLVEPCRNDENLKEQGARYLFEQILERPSEILKAFSSFQ